MIRMNEEQRDMCEEIAEHYGIKSQLLKTIEEMAELTQVIAKNPDDAPIMSEKFLDELADVCIMIEQLRYFCAMFGYHTNLNRHINAKLERQMKRIEEE